MIRYSLICAAAHEFDGWFRDSATFDIQAQRGALTCPICNSPKVGKAVMAPNISRSGRAEAREIPAEAVMAARDEAHGEARSQMRVLREKILAATDDVGERFPTEARKIQDSDTEQPRSIRGRASLNEVKSLLDDGIVVLPLPGEGN